MNHPDQKLRQHLYIALVLKIGALAMLWALFVDGAYSELEPDRLLPAVATSTRGVNR